ncbi:hypothetical protein MBAV_006198 [Candidatus Magnetobacterium bavaricum]|uniref:Uncharacterized protein n=1 Tax=Candidatus Magnetobacterium bavaricum TaxID=29290 RepID=A0A0F3GI21_9BACT|nr:hypothetical protein MBAV_006198 [Candidatus Magnetobacterium bavaricum]
MGAAFGSGRGLMVGLGAKISPTFASALAKTEPTPAMLGLANAIRSGEKLTAKGMETAKGFKLTPGERTALGFSDWATTTSLGAAAGASEPAQDWQERLTNIGVGAGSFALAHAAHPKSFSFLRPRTEGMDKVWDAAEQETPFEEKVRTYTEAGMPEQAAKFRAAKDSGLDDYFKTTKAKNINTVKGIHKAFLDTGVPPDVISRYYDYTTAKTESDKMRETGQTELVDEGVVSPLAPGEPDKNALSKYLRDLGYSDDDIRFVLWVNDVLFAGVDHTTLLHKALETGADVIDRQSAERQARLDAQDGVTELRVLFERSQGSDG